MNHHRHHAWCSHGAVSFQTSLRHGRGGRHLLLAAKSRCLSTPVTKTQHCRGKTRCQTSSAPWSKAVRHALGTPKASILLATQGPFHHCRTQRQVSPTRSTRIGCRKCPPSSRELTGFSLPGTEMISESGKQMRGCSAVEWVWPNQDSVRSTPSPRGNTARNNIRSTHLTFPSPPTASHGRRIY